MSKFQIFKAVNNEYRFRLKSNNGEIILSSEGYTAKQSCNTGIQSVKTNAPNNSNYDKKSSRNGEPYFVLKANNGEIIGTSEMYSSTYARDNGIEAVKRDAPLATIEDLT